MKQTTLCFLLKGNQVLLAMKKRGFGVGKWNGVGGKMNKGENIVEAAVREANEEIGVAIVPSDLESMGVLRFYFENSPEWDQRCEVFVTRQWEGEPIESEEMRPQWYTINDLPFGEMWIDDPYWVPLVLAGKKIKAEFHFNNNGTQILDSVIAEIK
jgi:8-oxo-dGTP pyrophosphatase MutT (NUDIX family)